MSRSIQYNVRRVRFEELGVVKSINEMVLPENYPFYFYETIYRKFPESFLVAEMDGEIVGYVMARVEREFRLELPLSFKRVGHIVSIAVLPKYRGMGIGSALMREVMNRLFNTYKVEYIYLEVRVSNTGAIKFYHRLGFYIERRVGSYYSDGEDAYIMVFRPEKTGG